MSRQCLGHRSASLPAHISAANAHQPVQDSILSTIPHVLLMISRSRESIALLSSATGITYELIPPKAPSLLSTAQAHTIGFRRVFLAPEPLLMPSLQWSIIHGRLSYLIWIRNNSRSSRNIERDKRNTILQSLHETPRRGSTRHYDHLP
jgi:hypothetical protein